MRLAAYEKIQALEACIWENSLRLGELPGEGHAELNKVQRAKIRELAKKWGKVYLVDLNHPDLVVQVYEGKGMVLNFTGTHAVPRISKRLSLLHKVWRKSPSYPLARAFMSEVKELGGVSLYWV